MTSPRLALCVTLISITILQVLTHPQCLDFRPPFEARSNLQLCSNYTAFGCCTVEDDQNLLRQYQYFQSMLSARDWNRCHGYIQELLCQSCSPYAAHIFDAERTMQAKSFPGLCVDYCLGFLAACGDVIPLLDPSLAGSRLLLHDHVFCQHVALTDVDYCYPDLLTSPVLNGQLQIQKETTEGCLCMEPVVEEVTSPIFAKHAGDGTGRVFVGEQPGIVRILYPRQKLLLPTPFLNISSRVEVSWSSGDERGFLGLAFHPRFSENGRFFIYYSMELSEDEDALWDDSEEVGIDYLHNKVRVSEMRVSASNPDRADPAFEKVLLEIGQPFSNHNGGELLFLDDGHLYVFVGDGGGGGDPYNVSQNKQSLLGKVLRLDVDSRPDLPYAIPRDNPFIHEEGTRPEIFALGVRNIWRCGVDPGNRKTGEGSGRVLCGDVGQNAHEEVDLLRWGANYGWRAKEGFACYDDELCHLPIGQNAHEEVDLLRWGANYGWRAKEGFACYDDELCHLPIENEELPVHSYPHSVGKSVTGGQFYRGCESPALDGRYIYGDYVTGRLFSLEEDGRGGWSNSEVTMCGEDVCFNGLTNDYDVHILSFGQDEDGEVYMLTSPSSRPRRADGRIFKIVDPLRRGNPSDCPTSQRHGRVVVNPTRPPPPRRNTPPNNNQQRGGAIQAPTIRQIQIRVCGATTSFLCHYLTNLASANGDRNG